ncbi:nitronate monooxygenase [bacterium]|nr:nitronate monooxygenase [bacterium]
MKTLQDLWSKGKQFLGVDIPVMCGAMTWISESGLVSTVSNAGAFGCLAGGNMDPAQLVQEIVKTRQLTDKPFAVNLITIAPNFKKQLEMVSAQEVPFIVFAGGIPKVSDIQQARASGAKVLCFASNESIAKRLIDRGADALMLEGSEAGGHIGHVSLIILLQQVLFQVQNVPVFVAGGIGTGRIIPHLLLMGAVGVQLGTHFVLTDECNVHPNFKEAFIRARARDAIATPQIGSELHVVAVRALRNKGMDQFSDLQMRLIQSRKRGEISQEEAQFEVERYWVGALRRAAIDGDIEKGSLMAGQSVGLAQEIKPIRKMLADLTEEAERELHRMQDILT